MEIRNTAKEDGWITGRNSWANIHRVNALPEVSEMKTEDLQTQTKAYETEISNLGFWGRLAYALDPDEVRQGTYFAMKEVLEKRLN